jgi:hypothetical protein
LIKVKAAGSPVDIKVEKDKMVEKDVTFSLNMFTVGTQMAWEDADKVSLAVLWYSHRQPWVRAA